MSYLQELTRKRRRGAAAPAAPAQPPTENLTAQQAALASSTPSGIVQVNAYAGTGKTASLCALAYQQASLNCLYLAFNKSAQQDAAKRFGPNTRCVTVHGLAFGSYGKRYAHKLGEPRSTDIIRLMGLPWNWGLAQVIIETIRAWCVSDWTVFPDTAKAIGGPVAGHPLFLAEAAGIAKQVWQRMCDPNDLMPMPHDGYLKLYQLSKPSIKCDLLMLDEAQDTNPVTWAIIQAQTCPVVIVGDRYQSIYKFRGAINAMEATRPTQSFPLTQSFRFGHRVAAIATELLTTFHHEMLPVEGLGPDTRIGEPPQGAAKAILARTNATVFLHAVDAIQQKKSLGLIGGVHSYGFDKLMDVNYLAQDQNEKIRDQFLRSFPSFEDFVNYSKEAKDIEAKRQIEIIFNYGGSLERLIEDIYKSTESNLSKAEVILGTAHKSKGLTLDHVVLADDFPELIDHEGIPLEPEELDRQEINLLYVAVTRTKHSLELNYETRRFLSECCMD
ncbi:UvrD-helicase domain-containing protein [Melaminivora jejuensis]|uniref:UvrD-helicase domain-containing protein n=1 Tax=Melaminivora jejuensis TaxID=1267217 RepID=UPI001AE04223|nr:UvrD-helicase domain-containing protein [Melaminivora jejuensis]UHJ63551.1 AAA family ATPase [Melaminivora jejuensis]